MEYSAIDAAPLTQNNKDISQRVTRISGVLTTAVLVLAFLLPASTVSAEDITWDFTGVISSTDRPDVGAVGQLIEMTFSIDEDAPDEDTFSDDVYFSSSLTNISATINGVTVYDGNTNSAYIRIGSEADLGFDVISWLANNNNNISISAGFNLLPTFAFPAQPVLTDSLQNNLISLAALTGFSQLVVCVSFSECIYANPIVSYTFASAPPIDSDSDGIPDAVDNCLLVENNSQYDSNGDGFGNACDADLDGNCVVNFLDFSQFVAVFLTNDENSDFNNDSIVNFLDLAIFVEMFGFAPGPSAVASCD